MSKQCSILLVPHLLAPLAGEDRLDRELNILQSGAYNVGFLGVSESVSAQDFLSWWQDRVYDDCHHALGEGRHYEQHWLDLVPAYFDGVHIVRDAGLNVGHWNLPERAERLPKVPTANPVCRFIRLSGFDPEQLRIATRYASRLSMNDIGPGAAVFLRYARLLQEAGYREAKAWPYAYDRFDNGVSVPEIARTIYRDLGRETDRFGDPLVTDASSSYFRWLNELVENRRRP